MVHRSHGDRSDAEKRRLPAHWAAREAIQVWLAELMGLDGSVVSVENSPETDEVEVSVLFLGHRRFFGFHTASLWFDIDPRYTLIELVLKELREPSGLAWFPLGGLAEDTEIRRSLEEG